MSFSSKNRGITIKQLTTTPFDVLVIGGGITGAGIALDASSRGLSVALVDMQDFAAGTSSRSTKLIHGGLRYLKQLDFKLVSEVGKERNIVFKNAPHLTKPEPMLLPIVKGGSLGKFSARLGMWLYEWLAGVKKTEWHKVLTIADTKAQEPLLRSDNLLGGILFYEYRTDDSRLTIEVLKEACNMGATAINYMKVVSFNYKNGLISGANVQDQYTKLSYSISANYIINASGPWVDELDDLDNNNLSHKLHITKGVHLVVDHTKLPVKQSAYFDTFDKRMLFVIPREGKTYIGTTDTFYTGDLIHPEITEEDRNYILKCANSYFPNNQLTQHDIESGWAGLRPLVNKPGKGPSEISRKDELFESNSGLITIAGGKLTGYRKMAQRVMDVVAKRIYAKNRTTIKRCQTETIRLSGGKINGSFSEFLSANIKEGALLGLSPKEAETIINRYGSNTIMIYSIIKDLQNNEPHELSVFLRAQIMYAIEYEMCLTPSDFFVRRTSALYFDIDLVNRYKNSVVLYMKELLNWTDEQSLRYASELEDAIHATHP
ncbi:MAG: FAD-dependent oxidoreductase [Bacteroidetes bacterium]|nr:FAD-dependent oxidoreductase [Bacteroidota bacterium]